MSTALYRKNVPTFERWLRITTAMVAVGISLRVLPAPWSWVGAVSAIGIALTGFFGYCPACAIVGRKL